MTDFSGFEPQVGEILAVRTFRIGPQGRLFPLYLDQVWSDEMNTAQCSLPAEDNRSHLPPGPGCTCGFYAYGTESAAMEYPHARHVLAVVACWGKIIAGTRGIRAQHARLEAIWMSDRVPADLAAQVTAHYPGATAYASREQMLLRHPATMLDCYELSDRTAPERSGTWSRLAQRCAVLLSVVPTPWFGSSFLMVGSWALQVSLLVLSAILNAGGPAGPAGPAAKRQWVLLAAAAFWVMAPTAGVAGWLMIRAPLLEIAVVVALARRQQAADSRLFPAKIGQIHRTQRRPGRLANRRFPQRERRG